MAVGVAEDANGVRTVLLSTSEPNGYLRPGVMPKPGEIVVRGGRGVHAEADIVNYANQNGLRIVAIGATRGVCDTCAQAVSEAGAHVATPLRNAVDF